VFRNSRFVGDGAPHRKVGRYGQESYWARSTRPSSRGISLWQRGAHLCSAAIAKHIFV
jgi:hypothetical protein